MRLVTVNIESLVVKDRIRQEMGDIVDLAESLEAQGQLQPIVINGNELKAGGRRYGATMYLATEGRAIGGKLDDSDPRKLEPGQILAIQYTDLSRHDQLKIEIEENTKRKDFSKAEEALGLKRLSRLMEELTGVKPSTKEIAKAAGVSAAHVSMGMRVADAVEGGNKGLLQSNSVKGAYDKLRGQEALAKRIEQVKRNVPQVDATKGLVCDDGLKWLKSLESSSVDLYLFDPPWGIGVDDYDRQQKYNSDWSDEKDYAHKLIGSMVPELYRTLRDDSWAVVFFGIQFYDYLKTELERAKFKVYPVPYIWYKPNKRGAQNDPSRFDMNQYEPFFLCAKGEPRIFKQAQGNVLSYDMPARSERFHFAQKSFELMKEIIERFSFGDMVVADPTFGSGVSIKAAKKLGRKYLGCEKDKENFEAAITFINQFES